MTPKGANFVHKKPTICESYFDGKATLKECLRHLPQIETGDRTRRAIEQRVQKVNARFDRIIKNV
ncbi:MAG: hypothetical protein VR72_12480 [Clostridiaceae bacterium BRH_c20a]|nr:MAG: hypothetical protein VR72_12480 [Clostridiaceae bacterium BRH_c20a]